MHFQQKARLVSKLRQLARAEVVDQLRNVEAVFTLDDGPMFTNLNPCGVTLTVFTPNNRRSDPDNLQPTLKAIMDGITESGLWSDDNHEIVKFTKYQFGGLSGSKAYRLEIEIESVKNNGE